MEPNAANDALWGSNGVTITPLLPPIFSTRQRAWRAAAWLKEMAIVLPEEEGQEGVTFEQILEKVQDS